MMTARKLAQGFAACLLVAAGAAEAAAQLSALPAKDAFCDVSGHEMQWFSPVDFDYDCLPIRRDCGYFFNYNRVSWYVQGEKSPLGSPGLVVLSEDIWPLILQSDPGQNPPPQYLVQNGIQDTVPGDFGWGDRYEFGYFWGPHSLMFGIIDDQRVNSNQTFGNGPQPSGFGSIHINFELASLDLLRGWRDYGGVVVLGTEVPTPTQGGPGVGGNGGEDDLDADLLAGTGFFFADLNGNGTPDAGEVTGIFADYGDGYEFNVTFNQVNVRNSTRTDGIEIMKNYQLDNSHWFVKEQRGQLEMGVGARFLRIRDEFGFLGTSDLLRGTTPLTIGNSVATDVDNQIVGPQLFLRYSQQRNRLRLGVDGRFVFGYNIQDFDQVGVIGENLTPGDLNQPFILQPTAFRYGKQENDFSPLVELRADAAYQITSALALKLGYTAIFVDNVSRAASTTRWRLPDMGFTEGGRQEILINGADVGFELVY
jgi:hypothetical protein